MTAFSIKIVVMNSITSGHRLNLDALLGSMIMQECVSEGIETDEAIRRATEEIPLERMHGVYAGSSALIPTCAKTSYRITGSLERHLMAIPGIETMIQKNERKRVNGRDFAKISKRFGPIMSGFVEHDVTQTDESAIWFTGNGDLPIIERLLDRLKTNGLGTKRRAMITNIVLTPMAAEGLPGILSEDGTVLRPVPCSPDFKPVHSSLADERFKPPYWQGERVTCHVPPHETWLPSQIYQMIGE